LDIPELSYVIQYEPPDETENYIHRAGRTGRAGAGGVAVTLVNSMEKPLLDRIARHYEIELEERLIPSDEDVAKVVAERLTALLEARLRDRDKLQTERSQRFIPLARELAEQEDELPIITMLLDDTYQKMLHPTVEKPKAEARPAQKSRPQNRRDNRRRSGKRR
jgi:ATP-dependent RNA helicase DeaD